MIVMAGEPDELNAEAQVLLPNARLARISPAFVYTMLLVGVAIEQLTADAVNDLASRTLARPKRVLEPRAAFRAICEEDRETVQVVRPDRLASDAIDALALAREEPGSVVGAYRRLEQKYGPLTWNGKLAMAGTHFALGHEISHHLLAHNSPAQGSDRAPGNEALDEWLASLDASEPIASRQHRREYRADALSILLGYSSMRELGQSGLLTASGAYVATLGLALLDDRSAVELSVRSSSHPTYESRCIYQLELIARAFAGMPEVSPHSLQRTESSRHPSGYSLQVLFLCQVIGAFISPR
jgi:hypothetical protein